MYEQFNTYEELKDRLDSDRHIVGAGASTANRFPVRFVLFDNFLDCCRFVEDLMRIPHMDIERLENWMDVDYQDTMLTHKRLADDIREVITKTPSEYRVIMPFSELARFYNNSPENAEFNSLINTIKSFDTSRTGFEKQQRVYIPIVGLQGKMEHFKDDSQSFIWYFHNDDRQLDYRLILTNKSTFGVRGLDSKYNVAENVSQWLSFWQFPQLQSNIISTSPAIFAHAKYAQPDNAFSYCVCNNAYEFLTKGLQLDLSSIEYREEESNYWEQLAQRIDISDFKFDSFFNAQFGIFNLADYNIFFETWFKNKNPYMRWLLAKYYTSKFCNQGYICRVLENLDNYTDAAFVKKLAITIFKNDNPEELIEERAIGMKMAAENGFELPIEVQQYIINKIKEEEQANGILSAIKYLSPLTLEEKKLILNWYSDGKIKREDLPNLYPDLYYYLGKTMASTEDAWVLDYFDQYKEAKVSNTYTETVSNYINEKNQNELAHYSWSSKFSDTRTLLHNRPDISSYYWIDGLGVDWIPFIQQIVKEHEQDGYYLNEAFIATAKLPSRTDINKINIQNLGGEKLFKVGDLDASAHTIRPYPQYVIEDMVEVRKVITKILVDHPGEKIAIISDHGISYLSQLCQGHNLSGYSSDHWGRIAETSSKTLVVNDDKYIVIDSDDKKILCALKHESLLKKIPDGMGCHGGCTPEEQLVPVLIISPDKMVATWQATLKSFDIVEANPIVEININGNVSASPMLEYDGHMYGLVKHGVTYLSDRLNLNKDVTTVTLHVGTQTKSFTINIKMAAQEDDLFAF